MKDLTEKIISDKEIMRRAKKYRALLHPVGRDETALAWKLELLFIVYDKMVNISKFISEFTVKALIKSNCGWVDSDVSYEGIDHFVADLYREFLFTQCQFMQLQKDRGAKDIAEFDSIQYLDYDLSEDNNTSAQ